MALCHMCPPGEDDVPVEMLSEHMQLMHEGHVVGVEVTPEEVTELIRRGQVSTGCAHSFEGVSRAYWMLREELSSWRSREMHPAPGRMRDVALNQAYGDGLEAACELVHALALQIMREAAS